MDELASKLMMGRCVPLRSVDESDVRRIVREELSGGKDRSNWHSPDEVKQMLDAERQWLADELSAAIEEAKQSGFLFTVEACVAFLRGKLIPGTRSVFNRNPRRAEGGQ